MRKWCLPALEIDSISANWNKQPSFYFYNECIDSFYVQPKFIIKLIYNRKEFKLLFNYGNTKNKSWIFTIQLKTYKVFLLKILCSLKFIKITNSIM